MEFITEYLSDNPYLIFIGIALVIVTSMYLAYRTIRYFFIESDNDQRYANNFIKVRLLAVPSIAISESILYLLYRFNVNSNNNDIAFYIIIAMILTIMLLFISACFVFCTLLYESFLSKHYRIVFSYGSNKKLKILVIANYILAALGLVILVLPSIFSSMCMVYISLLLLVVELIIFSIPLKNIRLLRYIKSKITKYIFTDSKIDEDHKDRISSYLSSIKWGISILALSFTILVPSFVLSYDDIDKAIFMDGKYEPFMKFELMDDIKYGAFIDSAPGAIEYVYYNGHYIKTDICSYDSMMGRVNSLVQKSDSNGEDDAIVTQPEYLYIKDDNVLIVYKMKVSSDK